MGAPGYKRNTRLYLLGTLIAIELLMSFSFLGYIHVEPISVTFAYIPVLAAAAVLGPAESTVLGAVFGAASMWKAGARYVMDADRLFSPFSSGDPFGSVMLSIGSRMLFGLAAGLLCALVRRAKRPAPWLCVVSYLGGFIHSLLVYSAMALFFPEAGYGPRNAVASLASPGDIVTCSAAALIVLLLWKLTHSRIWREVILRFEKASSLEHGERYHRLSLAVIMVLTLCFAMAAAFYFISRMDYVLEAYGIELSADTHADLAHLQIQFLIGILSLMALVIIFMIFNRRYATYINYEARLDALTGLLSRRSFVKACERSLSEGAGGWYVMLDVDRFKRINDSRGHPEGDRILREAAGCLRDVVGERGIAGRVGGDEFAALLGAGVTRSELETLLTALIGLIHDIKLGDGHVTCSIGAVPAVGGAGADALYRAADSMLYRAKGMGRDCFVIAGGADKG